MRMARWIFSTVALAAVTERRCSALIAHRTGNLEPAQARAFLHRPMKVDWELSFPLPSASVCSKTTQSFPSKEIADSVHGGVDFLYESGNLFGRPLSRSFPVFFPFRFFLSVLLIQPSLPSTPCQLRAALTIFRRRQTLPPPSKPPTTFSSQSFLSYESGRPSASRVCNAAIGLRAFCVC